MAGAVHALAKRHLAGSDDHERSANLYGLVQLLFDVDRLEK